MKSFKLTAAIVAACLLFSASTALAQGKTDDSQAVQKQISHQYQKQQQAAPVDEPAQDPVEDSVVVPDTDVAATADKLQTKLQQKDQDRLQDGSCLTELLSQLEALWQSLS